MRIELFEQSGKKKLDLHAQDFQVKIPDNATPVLLQATIDEHSPIQIVVNGGNGKAPRVVPVAPRLSFQSKERSFVPAFTYRRSAKTIAVRSYYRTKRLTWTRNGNGASRHQAA